MLRASRQSSAGGTGYEKNRKHNSSQRSSTQGHKPDKRKRSREPCHQRRRSTVSQPPDAPASDQPEKPTLPSSLEDLPWGKKSWSKGLTRSMEYGRPLRKAPRQRPGQLSEAMLQTYWDDCFYFSPLRGAGWCGVEFVLMQIAISFRPELGLARVWSFGLSHLCISLTGTGHCAHVFKTSANQTKFNDQPSCRW